MRILKVMVLIIMSMHLRAAVVYETDFENCTDSIPPGWLLFDNNGDGHYFAAINYSTGANSGNWFIRYRSYGTSVQGNDWAISDTFTLRGNEEDTLIFYVRAWSSSYEERLRVYLIQGDTPDDTVKLLWRDDNITNTNYQQKTVVFRAPQTGVYRIGFYSNTPPGRMAVLVDDVSVRTLDVSGNNLSIDGLTPYFDGWTSDRNIPVDSYGQPQSISFSVTVKNYGSSNFVNTRTYYRIDSAGTTIVPETQIGRDNINAGDTKTYTFNFTPSIYHMAEYDIYVYHNKATDPNNTYHADDTFHMHFIIEGHQGCDAYGWIWRDSYSVLGSPAGPGWIELSTDSEAEDLGLGDETSITRPLASPIKFYGSDYANLLINPNGIISFDQDPTGNDYENDSIPSSNASICLMPFWEDLNPGNGGAVYYRTFGDTLTVIEWYQVPIYGMDSTMTFQVQIQSNLAQSGVFDNITFLYYEMQYDEDEMDATIGIQDSSAQNGSGKFLYYTYNEQPYIPNWKNTKGIFAIKYYSPEALQVRDIAYEYMGKSKLYFAMQNAIDIEPGFVPVNVQVYSITGRKVNVPFRYNGHNLQMDFKKVSRGIYFVEVSAPGKREKFRVIRLK